MARNGGSALSRVEDGARSPERIRADIERTRAELALSVQTLRAELHRTVDWREWVRTNPAPFLIGAFTLGFIIGASGGRRR